jgi:hypothetical protein
MRNRQVYVVTRSSRVPLGVCHSAGCTKYRDDAGPGDHGHDLCAGTALEDLDHLLHDPPDKAASTATQRLIWPTGPEDQRLLPAEYSTCAN